MLGKLDIWRPDWTPRHPARQLTERLQAACALQAGNDPQAYSHSRLLMTTTADAVGILCAPSVPAIDRWWAEAERVGAQGSIA